MPVDVGSVAPDFTLPNQDRQPVRLNAELAKGPVVLAFVPAAFSSVCEKEFCTFRDSVGELSGLQAQVLGVSVDTFFVLKAWSDRQHFGFPLLSDFNKEVIAAYDVVNPDMIGLKNIAKRAVFVIGPDGIVRHKEVLADARNEPDYSKVRETLAAI